MSPEEVEKLIHAPGIHNFMDVTDFQNVGRYKYAENALPIPTGLGYQDVILKELIPLLDLTQIANTITTLSSFTTRYYQSATGVAASHWLQERFEEIAEGHDHIVIANVTHSFPQGSIIVTIPGANGDPSDLTNVVIIGGHLDSVGRSATAVSPGADDDATGTSTVLEIFRALVQAEYKPLYPVQFILYAGEEGGLLGSQQIAAAYQRQGIDVYAALQLDMTGYNRNGQSTVAIVTDYTNAQLNAFVRLLVPAYTTLNQGNYQCGYGCSDHASWNRTGYRSAFTFETPYGSNPYIHTENDLPTLLDPAQLKQFAQLGLSFVVELAGQAPEK